MILQKRLKEKLSYNKETGVFMWVNPSKRRKILEAGGLATPGYITIRLDGKAYLAHRLAWLYVYGEFPKEDIDHINHVKTDNSFDNLRAVNRKTNLRNASMYKSNTSGTLGVHFDNKRNKWVSVINVDGKKIHLGYFLDIDSARKARKVAEKEYDFHTNHGIKDNK